MAKRAFISHVAEEAKVAARLKVALTHDFLRMLDVFVSSDGESISAGDDWLESIDDALQRSALMLNGGRWSQLQSPLVSPKMRPLITFVQIRE